MIINIGDEQYEIRVGVGGIGYECIKEAPRAAKGWLGHCDVNIWGDGKFDFFPAKNDYSEDGWLDAVEKMCKESGTEFIGYQYAGRQQQKRQIYLDLAGKAKCDFFIAIDTEEYIDPTWMNWDRFYTELTMLSKYTKERMFYQWVYIPSEEPVSYTHLTLPTILRV